LSLLQIYLGQAALSIDRSRRTAMRSTLLALLLLAALTHTAAIQAQTWSHPIALTASPFVAQDNTCVHQPEQLILPEIGVVLWAPVVVYSVTNTGPFASKRIRPWRVQLYAQYPSLDLSILVCDLHYGSEALECSDASDNGPGMVNTVNVPGLNPGMHYIVVTGNLIEAPQRCGPYTLVANQF
jgi:hypothetical protein